MIMPVMVITGLHVMVIMVLGPLTDHVSIIVSVNLPVVMIIMNHIRIVVAINLPHAILFVVSQGSCVSGEHQRRSTEESKHLVHTRLGVRCVDLFNPLPLCEITGRPRSRRFGQTK